MAGPSLSLSLTPAYLPVCLIARVVLFFVMRRFHRHRGLFLLFPRWVVRFGHQVTAKNPYRARRHIPNPNVSVKSLQLAAMRWVKGWDTEEEEEGEEEDYESARGSDDDLTLTLPSGAGGGDGGGGGEAVGLGRMGSRGDAS